MKRRFIALALSAGASVSTLPLNAQASEECAAGLKDLGSTPALQSLLNEFGGINGIAGYWKLGGLAGAIQPTTIKFMTNTHEFSDQIAERKDGQMSLDKIDPVRLCVSSDEPDVLEVRPIHPIDPSNALVQIKVVEPHQSISLRNQKNGYHQFNRVSGFPPIGQPDDNHASDSTGDN